MFTVEGLVVASLALAAFGAVSLFTGLVLMILALPVLGAVGVYLTYRLYRWFFPKKAPE